MNQACYKWGKPNKNKNKEGFSSVVAPKNLNGSQQKPVVAMGVHLWIKHALRRKEAVAMWHLSEMSHASCAWISLARRGPYMGSLHQCVELVATWHSWKIADVDQQEGCALPTKQSQQWARVQFTRKGSCAQTCVCVRDIGERHSCSGSRFWRRVGRGHKTQWNKQTRMLRGVFGFKLSQTG